jgi:hypothetical protein
MAYDKDQIEALPTLLKFTAATYEANENLVELLDEARQEIERLREHGNARSREATQILIEEIGSKGGPEGIVSAAKRAVEVIQELRRMVEVIQELRRMEGHLRGEH